MYCIQKSYSGKALLVIICLFFLATSGFSQTISKKRGLAYGHQSQADMAAISKNISWWYNWSATPESAVSLVFQNYGMDFVPMAWNGSFNETALRTFYTNHPDSKYLLGFNEPNFTTQANMTPSVAAANWPRLEKIAKDFGLKIVSPALNYADKPVTENGVTYSDPIAYLDAFFAACPNCQVDYIALHNYMCYAGSLTNDIKRYKKYNKPIWLTEFACWDQPTITLDMQKGYMMGAIDYLESDTCIFRYSWFTGRMSARYPYLELFQSTSGQLTELGQFYVNFNPIHDPNNYTLIPARLEAENYSTMSGIAIEATKDVSGIANVGYIDANDWLEYNIEVPTTDDYTVYFRIASNTTSSLELRENKVALQTLQIPYTGGFQTWKTYPITVHLTAGRHIMQVYAKKAGFNLNWLEFTHIGQFPTSVPEVSQSDERVFPNPVKDQLFIERENNNGKTEVSVLDLSGRLLFSKVFNGETSPLEIDFSGFGSGSYIVRTKNSGNILNHLILK
jgi:hypothetical protein